MKPKLLTTLRGYGLSQLRGDTLAGITVALVAIPLSLAIAIASGASPAVGLVTAIVGGFVISLLGGSRVQIGGPTGAFIVVVYGVIATHGYAGWAVLEWECAIKHPEDGAREGAPFIAKHIIRVTEHAFDDFAAGGADRDLNKRLMGIG